MRLAIKSIRFASRGSHPQGAAGPAAAPPHRPRSAKVRWRIVGLPLARGSGFLAEDPERRGGTVGHRQRVPPKGAAERKPTPGVLPRSEGRADESLPGLKCVESRLELGLDRLQLRLIERLVKQFSQ